MTGTGTQTTGVTTIALLVLRTGELKIMVNDLKFHTPTFLTKCIMQPCITETDYSERSSLIEVYTVCHSNKYFVKQVHRKYNLGKKGRNKVLEILGYLS